MIYFSYKRKENKKMIHTLTIIWLIVSILNLALFTILILVGAARYIKKYPGVHLKKAEPGELVLAIIRILFISLLPILNVIMIFTLIFGYEKILGIVMETLESNIIEGI